MTSQYIITEEQLNDLAMYEDSEHDGKYAPICNDVRSHPYNPQAEREKVLDELLRWCNDNWTGVFIIQYGKRLSIQAVEFIRLKAMITHLRKGGE